MIQRTLVLIKPDGVQRALIGECIRRFENAGLKLVGMKMKHIDEDFAKKHYTEDIAVRRGESVRERLMKYITAGPVVAMVIEGIESVEIIRKLVGGTEPKTALPGTIRGDFSHHSFVHTDNKNRAAANIIHASGNAEEAEQEINLWFTNEELHTYARADDEHIL